LFTKTEKLFTPTHIEEDPISTTVPIITVITTEFNNSTKQNPVKLLLKTGISIV